MTKSIATTYMESVKPINKNTIKAIIRHTSRYIFADKEHHASCERCGCEFTLADNKHKSMVECPSCKHTLEVWRTDRKSLLNERKDWEAVAELISPTAIAIRYVLVYRQGQDILEYGERARHILDYTKRVDYYFENAFGMGWKKGTRNYFRESGMGCYTRNSWCCREADPSNKMKFIATVSKLEALKHLDIASLWNDRHYLTQFVSMSERADIYEKMQKVGLTNLIKDYQNSWESIKYDSKETSLIKMLGITKNDLAFLKEHQSISTLKQLQNANRQLSDIEYKALEMNRLADCTACLNKYGLKTYNYITKNHIEYSDYDHYMLSIARLGYPLDSMYRYPRDFEADYSRIKNELVERAKYVDEHRDELIKELKEKLYASLEVREALAGSNEFWVEVPECDEDFVKEGIVQHNCVGTNHVYSNKVAKGESIVLFIRRKLDDKPFVTMEYCNGTIAQLYYNKNEEVEKESNVYLFASHIANALKGLKVA